MHRKYTENHVGPLTPRNYCELHSQIDPVMNTLIPHTCVHILAHLCTGTHTQLWPLALGGGFILIIIKARLSNGFWWKEGEQHMPMALAAGRDPHLLLTLHVWRDPTPPAPGRCQAWHLCWKLSSTHFELPKVCFWLKGKKILFNIYQLPPVLLETVENV